MNHRKTNEQSSSHYTVSLTYLDSVYVTKTYQFEASGYKEFQQQFLKRFGNVYATQRVNKNKPLVKKHAYDANTVETFVELVNSTSVFKLHVDSYEASN